MSHPPDLAPAALAPALAPTPRSVPAPIPADDAARVGALRALALLDTPREPRFDRVTRLAQTMLDMPIAVVSLVDAERVWFKACVGLEAEGADRGVAFCAHAIAQDGLFEVPDTHLDPLFAGNPLVVDGPRIRFYAGVPLRTAEGHGVGTLCVMDQQPRSLTARQREGLRALAAIAAEELTKVELARALARAAEADRVKTEFLANMSHELRTPLNAILGYAELLLEDAELLDAPGLGADLGRIRHAGQQLQRVIGQILDLARLEAGKLELHPANLPLPAFVAGLADAVAPLAHLHGNRFTPHLAPGLPALHADPTLLRQALMELLHNACRFTQRGEVSLEARVAGGHVVFDVVDTGVGIAAHRLEGLFEPFAQADGSTTRQAGGTGLGLALARRFARLMGGDVTAASVDGAGSVFSLRVPLVAPARAEDAAAPAPGPAGAPRRVVLAIDDDPVVRDLLTRQLRRECFEVVTAASGAEGLALARALKPAAITLDVTMPDLDGWSVLEALKADPALAGIPVIMLSMVDGRTASAALGAADFVPKPFDRARLAAAITRAVA